MAVRGPFLYPKPFPPSRVPRAPLFERAVKVPIGWVMDRMSRPFVRWRPQDLAMPEVPIGICDLAPAFHGYRIALVTDLHAGPCVPMWWLEHVAAAVKELEPDVVALGGDFVSHARSDLDGLDRVLERFCAPDGVVAVLGNHDHWIGAEHVVRELERAGVKVLMNQHVMIQRGGAAMAIAGVDDFNHGAVRLDEAVGLVPADVPRVVLSHNPDLVEYIPRDVRVDVMLSGHTHNGQLHLPLVGPLTVPSQFGAAYLQGLKRCRSTHLYVSAGVGMASIPFRWGNPPELPLIVLRTAAPGP
jgi:predicted MPP superfamily phosphohydrolase